MIGADLLVAPILKPNQTERLVSLTEGTWSDYWTNEKYSGGAMIRVAAPLETVPMFARGGAIIPLGPQMNYIGEKPFDPISFAIYTDENGLASTTLYEDDGISPAYQAGTFRRTKIDVKRAATGYLVSIGAPEGTYNLGARKFNFAIKSSAIPKVITATDEGKARTIEIR